MSKAGDHDYHLHIAEMHNTGAAGALTRCSFIAFCSGIMNKPFQSQMVVIGDMSLAERSSKHPTWPNSFKWRLTPAPNAS